MLESCPWCASSEQKSWGGRVRGFQAVTCKGCGLIYVKNRLNQESLAEYYKKYFSDVHQKNPKELIDRSAMYQVEHDYIIQNISEGKLLDVGCSGGLYLDCFNSKDLNVEV